MRLSRILSGNTPSQWAEQGDPWCETETQRPILAEQWQTQQERATLVPASPEGTSPARWRDALPHTQPGGLVASPDVSLDGSNGRVCPQRPLDEASPDRLPRDEVSPTASASDKIPLLDRAARDLFAAPFETAVASKTAQRSTASSLRVGFASRSLLPQLTQRRFLDESESPSVSCALPELFTVAWCRQVVPMVSRGAKVERKLVAACVLFLAFVLFYLCLPSLRAWPSPSGVPSARALHRAQVDDASSANSTFSTLTATTTATTTDEAAEQIGSRMEADRVVTRATEAADARLSKVEKTSSSSTSTATSTRRTTATSTTSITATTRTTETSTTRTSTTSTGMTTRTRTTLTRITTTTAALRTTARFLPRVTALATTVRASGDNEGAVVSPGLLHVHPSSSGISLYCVSLIVPWGEEPQLMKAQAALHAGIFACDEWAVFSNVTMSLGVGVRTTPLATSLFSGTTGAQRRLMNSLVFKQLWRKVAQQGRWMLYNFTVKADPDTAFFPERLRRMVTPSDRKHAHMGNGIFFRQCAASFQGALEVLSRRAFSTFSLGMDICDSALQEDEYMHTCLLTLRVAEVDRYGVLASDPCGYTGWEQCETRHASFHPFRRVHTLKQCISTVDRVDAAGVQP